MENKKTTTNSICSTVARLRIVSRKVAKTTYSFRYGHGAKNSFKNSIKIANNRCHFGFKI